MRWALILFLLFLVGCSFRQPDVPSVVYAVVENDSSSNTWVVDAIDRVEKKRIRYVHVCDFYRWGNHEAVAGPTACDLSVGDEIAPNPFQRRPGGFLDVWPRGNTLSITRGQGDDRVVEQFSIKSAKVMPYTSGS
ncbi:MAG: hypothetical protein J0I96_14945 [Rhodanobacter sp.]|nr:hypothetical protein [Rhodanobacter sp.]